MDSSALNSEEDGFLSVTAALAKEAAVLFQSRRYSECIDVLKQLLQKKEDDPKVLHNMAVVEYFRDGCPDPKKLLHVLDKIKKRSEEVACACEEQIEASDSFGSTVTSVSRGTSPVLHQFSSPNSRSITYANEFDTSTICLNTAIILYHLHDYSHALSVLEPLYQNIVPIEETTALHICLLLLDIALVSQDARKAADIIKYLEKSFSVGSMLNITDNGSISQNKSSNQIKVPARSNNDVPDAFSSDLGISANAAENNPVANLSDDALEYETLYSTLDNGNQNLGRTVLNALSKASSGLANAADINLKFLLCKVRLLLLTRDVKVAKRDLKLAMNMSQSRDSSAELLLKSQVEFARGNHRKAFKLLGAPSNREEPAMFAMLSNNLGCILHQQRSHNLSSWFFSKALRSSTLIQSEKPLKLATFSQDKSRLISYNCGLQHLVCGKPLLAASCFREALPMFYNRPLFWLRFAECCLQALEMGLLNPNRAHSHGEIEVSVAGLGKWRQLVVNHVPSTDRYSNSGEADGVISDKIQGLISLPFARQCLLNALILLEKYQQKTTNNVFSTPGLDVGDPNQAASISDKNSSQESTGSVAKVSSTMPTFTVSNSNGGPKGGVGSNATLMSSVSSYEKIRREEMHKINEAILRDLAYVELCLGNPLRALSAAKELQQLPFCSRISIFLSHVYAAEALCQLNRPTEAAEQLSIYVVGGNHVKFPYPDEDRKKLFIEKNGNAEDLNSFVASEYSQGMGVLKPEEVRGVLYTNLATMFALQGDLERASNFVNQGLSSLPNNPRVLLAAVYLDLLAGKTQEALPKLKEHRSVRFLQRSVTVKQLINAGNACVDRCC